MYRHKYKILFLAVSILTFEWLTPIISYHSRNVCNARTLFSTFSAFKLVLHAMKNYLNANKYQGYLKFTLQKFSK